MTEEEARAWLVAHGASAAAMTSIERFIAFLIAESERQNLISAATRDHVWARHVVDSAQLVGLAEGAGEGIWLDLGTGAGFPGLIVAILTERPIVLAESRRMRIDFLNAAVALTGLEQRVSVAGCSVERLDSFAASVISARAFAPLDRLFTLAARFSRSGTLWVLPKGRSAQSELAQAAKAWQGVFHVKQSVTDPESSIIVARDVRRGTTA